MTDTAAPKGAWILVPAKCFGESDVFGKDSA
jgi:hypothetical protein